MLVDEENISSTVGQYLLAIERLTQAAQRATTKEVADFLNLSQSTVTEYLKRLAAKGLVCYEWRAGCALTHTGATLTQAMLRRQRLLKVFMVEQLHYALHDVYQESLAMQHTLTDHFVDALDALLGYPIYDPHGEPIPRPNHPAPRPEGSTTRPRQSHIPLTEAAVDTVLQVCVLPDWRTTELEYLCEMGIVPGVTVRVLHVPPLHDPLLHEPLLLEVRGQANHRTVALSPEIGQLVRVCSSD